MPHPDGVPTLDEVIAAEDQRIRTAVTYILNTRVGGFGQLVGEVMKHLQGKANPSEVARILREELANDLLPKGS